MVVQLRNTIIKFNLKHYIQV